jgi:hypothetical protein
VTHEYVIALYGRIDAHRPDDAGPAPTAIAWAADHVLAVGTDDIVRAISRGDSTFLDIEGCVVTALPENPERATSLVRDASHGGAPELDVGALLIDAGLLDRDSALEPGSVADLAFWGLAPEDTDHPRSLRLVATVRDGAFTEGDEHTGPFPDGSTS